MPPTPKITRDFYARGTLTVARELIGMHLVGAEGPHDPRGPDSGDGSLSGPSGPCGPLLPRSDVANGGHVRTPRARVRVLHLRLLVLPEPRDGGGRCATRRAAARAGAGHGHRRQDLGAWTPLPGDAYRQEIEWRRSLRRCALAGGPPVSSGPLRIARSERIGVEYAGDWARRPWRFYDRDSPYVSTAPARLRAI